ncbi:unnamed protein product [Kluyveromyces dobzhanskii CBS 2104]|nr:unnamed protein product [Kluyveromyces dobzhanskii CBS 2104]
MTDLLLLNVLGGSQIHGPTSNLKSWDNKSNNRNTMKARSMYLGALLPFLLLSPAASAPAAAIRSDTINLLEPDFISNSTSVCFHSLKYSFDVTELPLPEWLDDWDSLLPAMPCDDEYFVSVPKDLDNNTTAKMLAYSLASGFAVDNWNSELQKRDAVLADLDAFWDTGDVDLDSYDLYTTDDASEDESQGLQKRWATDSNIKWSTSSSNKAKVSAFNGIKDSFSNCGYTTISLGRSAFCMTADGNYGCFSWSGGGKEMLCRIGYLIVENGISGQSVYSTLSEHASHCFQDAKNNWHSCCLSNRASGCS